MPRCPEQRNILRLIFCNPQVRAKMPNWERHARLVVSTFRLETARAGANERSMALIDDLNRASPEFAAMWQDNNVSSYGEGVKRIVHPVAGPLAFDYSTFAVDGRPDLGLVVYTPATPADEGGRQNASAIEVVRRLRALRHVQIHTRDKNARTGTHRLHGS